MGIVVEFIDAGDHSVAIRRFDSNRIIIGRAYDCDLIIADPYVDPHHCRIDLEPEHGRIQITDLQSINGIKTAVNARNGVQGSNPGELITIGKTRLRVRSADNHVPAAQQLTGFDQFIDWTANYVVCAALVVLTAAYAAGRSYLYSNARFQPSDLFEGVLSGFTIIILITAFWSLIGKISRRKANMRAHLSIACLFWLAGALWATALQASLYNLNASGANQTLEPITASLILIGGQYMHMTLATSLGMRTRGALLAAIFLVYPGLNLYKQVENADNFRSSAPYSRLVFPPAWQFSDTSDTETFISDTTKTFTQADEDAARRNREEQDN